MKEGNVVEIHPGVWVNVVKYDKVAAMSEIDESIRDGLEKDMALVKFALLGHRHKRGEKDEA